MEFYASVGLNGYDNYPQTQTEGEEYPVTPIIHNENQGMELLGTGC